MQPRPILPLASALSVLALAFALAFLAPPPGASAQTLAAGSRATVTSGSECLRVRSAPSLSSSVLTCLPDGATVTIAGGTQDADGVNWVRITSGAITGWVASQYLQAAPGGGSGNTAPPAELTGNVPSGGGFGLVVWGPGGSPDRLASAAGARGCGLTSAWVTRPDGSFVGYVFGAPAFVNQEWGDYVGAALPGGSPLILVCAAGGQASVTAPPPPSPSPPSNLPPGVPPDIPPGPAGNS